MGERMKEYNEKLQQTQHLLRDLGELRKKGKHVSDDSIVNKLEQFRKLMELKEQWVEKYDDNSLDEMIIKMNTDLQIICKLEGRPEYSAAEILENASAGLALRGILVGGTFHDGCLKRAVLRTPTDVTLKSPAVKQIEDFATFSSKEQFEYFQHSFNILGYNAAATFEGSGWGFKAKARFSEKYQEGKKEERQVHKKSQFESRVMYSVFPTAACELNPHSLKFSEQALLDLKSIDKLLVGSDNLELVDKKCEDFFTAYGSHINAGVLHFGGVNKFVATYISQIESQSGKVKSMLRDALSAYVSGRYSGFGLSFDGVVSADQMKKDGSFKYEYEISELAKIGLHFTTNGGPQGINALQLWKTGLASCSSNWALIDRGQSLFTDFVGVWELISNHKGEFEEPYELESSLVTVWERMSGFHGYNDQERTFRKGLEDMDLLIEKIAMWNSAPILPENCIEYLQEMVQVVEDVETQTCTNKYWVNKLCTEVQISNFLGKVVELRDKFDVKNMSMIRLLIRKLVNPVGFREFPGKQMITEWVVITKSEDVPSLLDTVNVKSTTDLISILNEKFIPTLQIEHANNLERNAQVSDSINVRATVDLARCVGKLLKDLRLSEQEHEMFFLKVVLLSLHYNWPTRNFETLLTMKKLQTFIESTEILWRKFQFQKEKGMIQLEAFLINTSLTSGHFDGGESSEDEFTETVQELRQVLSPELNKVLNSYATQSPFNWGKMTSITAELAKGNMLVSAERKITIGYLENVASSSGINTHERRSVVTTNRGIGPEGQFLDVLKILGLEKLYPSKISRLDAMVIKRTPVSLKPVDIPWMIIHKLLMIDFHARDHLLSVVNTLSRENRPDDGDDFDFESLLEMQNSKGGEDSSAVLNTLDVLVAIFTCCDAFLKQTLAQKLFVCKLAIPFLYPLGCENRIGMSIWALRTINVQRHNKPKEASETPVTEEPFPLVSFIRLGRPPHSKSKLMNDILRDDSHNTFFHHDCNNGTVGKRITDGLVECSWFITAGKEKEHLPGTTMLLNLRGDASFMKKQREFLQEISSVLFVLATVQDLGKPPNSETCKQILQAGCKVILFLIRGNEKEQELRSCFEAVGKDALKGVPLIISSTQKGVQKNASELKAVARKKLSEALAECSGIFLEKCAQCAKEMGIIVDEYDDKACLDGKRLAEKVVNHMKTKQIVDCKTLLLPLQGDEWIEYCQLQKRQHRSGGKGSNSSTYEADQVKQTMDHLRDKQVEICNRLTPFIKDFMSSLQMNQDVVMYFLKWMNLLLDEKSRANLPGLRKKYHTVWTEFQQAKKEQDEIKLLQLKSKVDDKEKQLSRASLGLENLFRELGQIYEAVKGSGEIAKTTRVAVECLPERAAELLLKGSPLELVDGDASSIPIAWVSAVLKKLGNIVGNKKIFVLSVLGIQSSGKSTLLNTMFGLQFAVSAGRCTRGAYMQLIPVDRDANLPFHYVAVVDTEGLRAPELGQLKYEHDNELATLVIGLGDVTMINIKGENTAEMKDILQIAVHAFLRMNLVRKNIQDNRTCLFVHQNVPAANAEELMMHGCQKLQESLDNMAKEAAISENIADIHSFSQIINFDVQKHVWYFSDLWHGDPPMAPSNPGYSEKVESVRFQLLEKITLDQKTFLTASELSIRLSDLWKGVLADDFVFSFRNSLEVKAYNSLQSKYYNLEWKLQDKVKSWLHNAEIELKRCETVNGLEKSYLSLITKLSIALAEKADEIKKDLREYFEKGELQEIIIQWRETKLNQLNFAVEQQQYEGRADLLSIKEARRVEILQAQKWSNHEVYIMNKAVELADKLKGKEASDDYLEERFESMWILMVNELATKTQDKDLRMDIIMEEILHQRLHAQGGTLRNELNHNPLKNPLEQSALESSITLEFVKKEHISVKRSLLGSVEKAIKSLTGVDKGELEARKKTVGLTMGILKEIITDLKVLAKHDVKFQKSYATAIIKKIVERIDDHNQNAYVSEDCNFTILPKYVVKLAVHVGRHCVHVFTLMQWEYKKKHGVKAKLKEYKETAWSLFKNKVEQSTEEVLAGDLLTKHLKRIVLDAVQKAIPRKCTEEVLRDFQMTKYYLMVKIMDDLATKANFKNYELYIKNAKVFALKWLTQYTGEKMFSRKGSGSTSRYAEISRTHIARIMQCIVKSISYATNEVEGQEGMRMALWIEKFCQRVSEEIAVPVSTLALVRGRSVMDFNNLQRIILDQLDKIQVDLERAFLSETRESVTWCGRSPPEQVLDKIWGCSEQCPFCKEPCADTTPDHYHLSGISHMCVQHRPQGIGGMRWVKDGAIDGLRHRKQQLFHQTCNYDVQRENVSFKCTVGNYKCRNSGKCSMSGDEFVYHKYTEYKTYMPDWDIAPDRTNSVSKYWTWFMATYQSQLKDMHRAKLPDIPKDWKKITKEEALTDLRKIHH